MNDLDTRLRALADPDLPTPTSPSVLRERAGVRRRRKRRTLGAGMVVVFAIVSVGIAFAVTEDDGGSTVRTGPSTTDVAADPTSTTAPSDSTIRRLGDVGNATMTVTPAHDLLDGSKVTVDVRGYPDVGTAMVVQCIGTVSAETATSDCDLSTSTRIDQPTGDSAVVRDVIVSRTLPLPGPEDGEDDGGTHRQYDCLTEPAGCVLAVGSSTLPVRGIAVPITFRPQELPEAQLELSRSTGLRDGDEIDVHITGVRPNAPLRVAQCRSDGQMCDELEWPGGDADASGSVRTTVTAHAAIYGWKGRVDCARESCSIRVIDRSEVPLTSTRITFADGVVAPVPKLSIDQPGPYRDAQVVTVRGTGFPPGFDVGRWIGICPADRDPAKEERCGYPGALINGGPVVEADGTFETEFKLFDSLATAGSCVDNITGGCLLSWVLNHGPAAVSIPLPFTR